MSTSAGPLRLVASSSDPAFQEVLRLAHANFSPSFLEPDQDLVAEVDGHSRVPFQYLVWDDGVVRGFARFARLRTVAASFIVHLAVDEPYRREGLGLRLLDGAHLASGGPAVPMLAEVEEGAPMTWWRERARAQVISDRYTQPALRADTEPQRLSLLARGHVSNPRSLIERFYDEVWELPPGHPFVVEALAGSR